MRKPRLIADRENDNATLVAWDAKAGRLLLRPDIGLIDRAVGELEGARELSRAARRKLGDLYLRKGLIAKARATYAKVPAGDNGWDMAMRRGLCDWADGDFAGAVSHFQEALRQGPRAAQVTDVGVRPLATTNRDDGFHIRF